MALKRSKKIIALGAEALRLQERTVSFEKAVEAVLEARKDRRVRTVYDFRYFTRRFMKRCKGLAEWRVRSISPQEIEQITTTAEEAARRVTIHKPLLRILRAHKRKNEEKICPANRLHH